MQVAIGLSFPGELKDESVICCLCKKFDIELVIIEASFSMSRGWAILKIKADEKEIKRSLEFLENKKIKVEKLQTEK
jgi:ABC-type methionine transport system ATPase subunit